MQPGLYAYQSNSLEALLEQLYRALFVEQTDVFHDRLVVVPHAAMKSWLQYRLASCSPTGIASGMRILTEQSAMADLMGGRVAEQEQTIPSVLELSFAIEKILWDLVEQRISLDQSEEGLLAPLLSMVADPTFSQTKKQRRLLQLARELAGLFDTYGRHGARLLFDWGKQPAAHWQIWIWKELYARFPHWQALSLRVNKLRLSSQTSRMTVALFGVSYLPPLYHRLLHVVSQSAPVIFFTPSVCQHYWADLSPGIQIESNSLLTSLGRLGRRMAAALDEFSYEVQRHYYFPEKIIQLPHYADRINEDSYVYPDARPLSLLQQVQADIVLLRDPSGADSVQFPRPDTSIQVHSAPTRLREVEALYNTCVELIHEQQNTESPIAPSDILVIAPDISVYQASLSAVFGREGSQLHYCIHDQPLASQSALINVFQDLIGLATSRWETTAVLRLLENPLFQAKQRWSQDDLHTIRDWLRDSTITWGWDLAHRNRLLKQAHCVSEMRADAASGTWEEGVQLLLRGLIAQPDRQTTSVLSFSDTDLFSRWIATLESLWADLAPLHDDCAMQLLDWARYLECLIDAYLQPSETQESDRQRLLDVIAKLKYANDAFPHTTFSSSSIRENLRNQIASETLTAHDSDVQVVRFGSFHALSGIPYRVIFTIGLDETAFPSRVAVRSLDLLRDEPKADPIPLPSDLDRYHFLLALLSARDVFGVSYVNTCPKDGKDQGPSLIISELQSYLNRYYDGAGNACVRRHPFFPFDASYFKPDARPRSYSQSDYAAARALYQAERSSSLGFLPELYSGVKASPAAGKDLCTISLADLKLAARNPLKLYLKYSLEMALCDLDSSIIPEEEPFVLSPFDRYNLRRESLHVTPEVALKQASMERRMPLGAFADLLDRLTHEEAKAHLQALDKLQVSMDEVFTFELSEFCMTPRQLSERAWMLPAPQIPLGPDSNVRITGTFSDVTPRGVIVLGKDEAKQRVRNWPLVLVLHELSPIIRELVGHPFTPHILLINADKPAAHDYSGKCEGALEQFIHYTQLALTRPSPLLDEWVKHFLDDEVDTICQRITESLKNDSFHNEEAKWLFQKDKPLADIVFWKKQAQIVYETALAKEGRTKS